MVHILAQSFGHCPIALVGVHDGRQDILLAAHNLHGGFIGIGIELLGKFIAAVVVEVSGVHIEYQLAIFHGIGFETSGGDHLVLFHLFKHFCISGGRSLEVDVQGTALRFDVLIAVAVFFTFVVFLHLCQVIGSFNILIAGYGAINSIISCHRSSSFLR